MIAETKPTPPEGGYLKKLWSAATYIATRLSRAVVWVKKKAAKLGWKTTALIVVFVLLALFFMFGSSRSGPDRFSPFSDLDIGATISSAVQGDPVEDAKLRAEAMAAQARAEAEAYKLRAQAIAEACGYFPTPPAKK